MRIFHIARSIIGSMLFKKPFYTHLYVTKRCNLTCRMCSIWKSGSIKEELPADDYKRIAEQMKKMGVAHVVITGGEPFLRTDLPLIVRYVVDQGISVRIQTNAAFVTERMLDDVIAAGVEHLTISLDSLDEKKFDYICNSQGLLPKVKHILEQAVLKLPKGMIIANTVISRYNCDEIPDIIRYVDSIKAYSSLVPVHTTTNKNESNLIRNFADDLMFTEEDAEKINILYDRIIRMKNQGFRIGSSLKYLHESRKALLSHNYRWLCAAGILYFVVYPDGSVAPCDEFPGTVNILAPSFVKIYNSPGYRTSLRHIRQECRGCIWGCWRETSYLIENTSVLLERIKTYILELRKP